MKKLALHWKILIGMILGILFGLGMTIVPPNSGTNPWYKSSTTI